MRKSLVFCLAIFALTILTSCSDLLTAPDENEPERPCTSIQFTLEEEAEVLFFISNNNLELVDVLINEPLNAGHHRVTWMGKDMNDHTVASGVYYYTLMTNDYLATRAMLVLK